MYEKLQLIVDNLTSTEDPSEFTRKQFVAERFTLKEITDQCKELRKQLLEAKNKKYDRSSGGN